jgi:hypothetical protein
MSIDWKMCCERDCVELPVIIDAPATYELAFNMYKIY